jgi:DNA-binding PadR family transcriptional regulator
MKLLSDKEVVILRLLVDDELYGLQLVERSRGRLKRGTVYVTLGRMEDKGLVASRVDGTEPTPGLPRKLYRPTALGRRTFEAWEMVRAKLSWARA